MGYTLYTANTDMDCVNARYANAAFSLYSGRTVCLSKHGHRYILCMLTTYVVTAYALLL